MEYNLYLPFAKSFDQFIDRQIANMAWHGGPLDREGIDSDKGDIMVVLSGREGEKAEKM